MSTTTMFREVAQNDLFTREAIGQDKVYRKLTNHPADLKKTLPNGSQANAVLWSTDGGRTPLSPEQQHPVRLSEGEQVRWFESAARRRILAEENSRL